MTLVEFIASRQFPDAELTEWLEANYGITEKEHTQAYGPDHGYLIHWYEGMYYVHAWWYPPIGYTSLVVAQGKLYDWYRELET